MTRIEGPNNINNNPTIGLNKVGETSTAKINSTFGDGFGSSKTEGFGHIERSIEGLDFLTAKFNFDVPKYDKNIAQLTIADKDYIPDRPFEEEALCEV